MDSRRSPWNPALLLFGLAALWGGLSCSGSLPGANPGFAGSEAPVPGDHAFSAPTNGGVAAAQRQIEQREYRTSANRDGLQAPNRAHNLRTYFAPTGIRVHDRTQPGSPELLSLSLARVGRGENPAPVEPGEVTSLGARVEIARPGLVEWFENSSAGLEQGVTLTQRPSGTGPLVVELDVNGADASLRGESVTFATATGRRLSYAKLAALDAHGVALDAHFALPDPARLQLVVDDEAAVYPVVIDPLLTATPDTQFESDQVNANLGTSVAGAGDVNGDGYDDVIVGASAYDAGEANEGAAFIFLGSAAGIADGNPATAATQLESDQAGAYFGVSVAGAGDVNDDGYDDVIVGSYLYSAGQNAEGAAFVFLGSAAGIADGNPSTADTQLESDQANAYLGYSVASAGDVDDDGYADVIVGAYLYDTGLANLQCTAMSGGMNGLNPFACCTGPGTGTCLDEGAVFVFRGGAGGIADGNPGTAATQLVLNQPSAWFGWSVAGAGDVNGDGYDEVIVGAPTYETPISTTNEGAAFIFLGSGAGIADGGAATAATRIESNKERSLLGNSVAGAGDVNGDGYDDVIVGAYHHEVGANDGDEGVAFIFLGSGAGIPNSAPALSSDAVDCPRPSDRPCPQTRLQHPATQLESNQLDAWFGTSVASLGDINGDGYDDVIVGAIHYTMDEINEGAAFVFLGSAAGISDGNPSTAAIQLESNQANAWLGWSVAAAGDVNDDGVDDVIVGAPLYDANTSSEGAAFVYLSDPVLIPVPEPTLIAGFAAALAGLAILARLRRQSSRTI